MTNREPDKTPSATLRRILLLLVVAVVLAFGLVARADSVRLYEQAGVEGPRVTLGQVAKLDGAAARAHADLVVLELNDQREGYTLTLDQLEQALGDAGVNWGRVSLRGYDTCKVTRLIEPEPVGPATDQAVAANIQTPIGLNTSLTLRQLVEQQLTERIGNDRGDLRLSFSNRDAEKLNLPVLGRSVEIEPTSDNRLGRIPVVIRLYEGRVIDKTLHVGAKAERVMLAVVAAAPVSRGQRFTRDDLQVRECVIDNDGVEPITDPSLAIGQQAATTLREGEVVTVRAVRPPVLIKRGELVDVRCFVGGLVIRTVGIASADGALDDMIKVRNDSTGDTFYAVVTGRREVVVSIDDRPVADGTTAMADNPTDEVTP